MISGPCDPDVFGVNIASINQESHPTRGAVTTPSAMTLGESPEQIAFAYRADNLAGIIDDRHAADSFGEENLCDLLHLGARFHRSDARYHDIRGIHRAVIAA
jgi:hypothetical protein